MKIVVCQPALEQGYEIENVTATEGTDFFVCKLAQLVITKLQTVRVKRNCYLGYNMYAILIGI